MELWGNAILRMNAHIGYDHVNEIAFCSMLPVSVGIAIVDCAKIRAWAIKFGSTIMLPLLASHRVFSTVLGKKSPRLSASVAGCVAPSIRFG